MKRLVRRLLSRAARGYAAGPDLDDALRASEKAATRGCSVTLCYWHKALDPAEEVAERYRRTILGVSRAGLDAHLALKVPGLWERQDLAAEIVAEARRHGIPVDIDSHEPEKAESTFRVAESLDPATVGIAVPARWRNSLDLAERAVARGLRVRVVKGSWADPDDPGIDPDTGYRAVIARLAGRCRAVGVATHDPALARDCLDVLARAGTPAIQELVYGLPMQAPVAAGRAAGVETRVYIPYGHAWVPYAMSRAVRDPRILGWMLRDLATGGRDSLPPAPATA